ncbi:MAG: hypothetical protein VZR00_09440 [Lachnospiraceae bacterium]|nr:hypothetical protein [Lachnospiraceae bacterium]
MDISANENKARKNRIKVKVTADALTCFFMGETTLKELTGIIDPDTVDIECSEPVIFKPENFKKCLYNLSSYDFKEGRERLFFIIKESRRKPGRIISFFDMLDKDYLNKYETAPADDMHFIPPVSQKETCSYIYLICESLYKKNAFTGMIEGRTPEERFRAALSESRQALQCYEENTYNAGQDRKFTQLMMRVDIDDNMSVCKRISELVFLLAADHENNKLADEEAPLYDFADDISAKKAAGTFMTSKKAIRLKRFAGLVSSDNAMVMNAAFTTLDYYRGGFKDDMLMSRASADLQLMLRHDHLTDNSDNAMINDPLTDNSDNAMINDPLTDHSDNAMIYDPLTDHSDNTMIIEYFLGMLIFGKYAIEEDSEKKTKQAVIHLKKAAALPAAHNMLVLIHRKQSRNI